MSRIPQDVREYLTANSLWHVATCANNKPNVAPLLFTAVSDDDKLLLGNVFMNVALENVKANPNVAISVAAFPPPKGYQVKGKGTYSEDAKYVSVLAPRAEKMGLTVKGVIVVEIDEIIVTTPGPDVGKAL